MILQRVVIVAALLGASPAARAAFLAGEVLDTAADVLAWIVIILVPVVAIVVFWLVHILPEKIAEHRHHPQQQAIKVLCLLSLVFGGMLWPIAWLWAYTRPVMYRMAYGTEKHESYFEEAAARARAGAATADEIRHLREELEAMQARGALPAVLQDLLAELRSLHELAQARQASPAPAADGGPR